MTDFDEFTRSAFVSAGDIWGWKSLVIESGESLSCRPGEDTRSRDFEVGGFEGDAAMTVTVDSETFWTAYTGKPADYLGRTAVVDGKAYIIDSMATTDSLLNITLVDPEASR